MKLFFCATVALLVAPLPVRAEIMCTDMSPALVASTYRHVSDDVQRETANAIGRRAASGKMIAGRRR